MSSPLLRVLVALPLIVRSLHLCASASLDLENKKRDFVLKIEERLDEIAWVTIFFYWL